MFAPIILYVLMVAGFIGSGWATDGFFRSFRAKDEQGRFDALFAILIWGGLFGSYGYLVCSLFH